jgi:hypothetical protein
MKKIFAYIIFLTATACLKADVTEAGLNIGTGETDNAPSQNVNSSPLTKTSGKSTYNFKMDN